MPDRSSYKKAIYPDIPEHSVYLKDIYIDDVMRVLKTVDKNLTRISMELDSLDEGELYDDLQIRERAFNRTYTTLIDTILQPVVVEEIKRAVIDSVEFNYKPFVDMLLDATIYHLDSIVSIEPHFSSKSATVYVDFSILGTTEEYADVVKKARETMGKGLTPSPEWRSRFWMEKIYGVDREGVKIVRVSRKDGKQVDITKNYRGKYRETIITRLNLIPMNKAPFWQLLDAGNTSYNGGSVFGAGTAYPTFAPTNFVSRIRIRLADIFEELYREFYFAYDEDIRQKAELAELDIEEDDKIGDIAEKYVDKIADKLDIENLDINIGSTIKKLRVGEQDVELFKTPTGRVAGRVRGKGGLFVKLEKK